jgi:long-chain acyl-CoA synthetase
MEPRPWHKSYPRGLQTEIDVGSLVTTTSAVEKSLAQNGQRIAISCFGESVSYGELDRYSKALAAYWQAAELKKGDRVAFLMPNGLAYPVALIAALRAGLIVVTVNPLYTEREIENQLGDSGARCVVCMQEHVHVLLRLKAPGLEHIVVAPGPVFRQAGMGVAGNAAVAHGKVSVIGLLDAIGLGGIQPDGRGVPAVHRRNHRGF